MYNIKDNSFSDARFLISQAIKKIEELATAEGMSGVASGFQELDKITSGWQPSDLIIIASRTSIGKSSLVLSMVRNMAIDFNMPVAIFSPEMTSNQIMNRLISFETGLSLTKLRTGKLEKHEWEALSIKTKNLEAAPIYVDDTANLSIQNLSVLANQLVFEKDIRAIFIDNIHLLSAGNNEKSDITREQEISIIARKLKTLAKELNIPVIAISQLSREKENKNYINRPTLSDLRGSGTLEEIADIVSFIYRPEYYKIDEWDDDECSPSQGQAEFIIAKHRNGSLKNIRLKFIQNVGKFDNLDYYSSNEINPFQTKNLPSANEAFGSSSNNFDDDSEVPF
ncbi:Replicative DNA helicase (fragment) [Flavobacterium psychrophilum]